MTKELELITRVYELQVEMTETFLKYFREQNTTAMQKYVDALQAMMIQMRAAAQ